MEFNLRNGLKLACLPLALIVSLDSIADNNQYRWLNSRGVPVYSDRPPPAGVDYEVVSTTSTLKRVVSAEEGAVPLEIQPTAGNDFESVDSAEEGGDKKNAALCQKARMNLIAVEQVATLTMRNEQGEMTELSPEEREEYQQKTEEQITLYCE